MSTAQSEFSLRTWGTRGSVKEALKDAINALDCAVIAAGHRPLLAKVYRIWDHTKEPGEPLKQAIASLDREKRKMALRAQWFTLVAIVRMRTGAQLT